MSNRKWIRDYIDEISHRNLKMKHSSIKIMSPQRRKQFEELKFRNELRRALKELDEI